MLSVRLLEQERKPRNIWRIVSIGANSAVRGAVEISALPLEVDNSCLVVALRTRVFIDGSFCIAFAGYAMGEMDEWQSIEPYNHDAQSTPQFLRAADRTT